VPTEAIQLSLVLPAYNEALRLPPYLEKVRAYLDAQYGSRYEVIVVDDGSEDGLGQFLDGLSSDWPQLRSIRHPHNLGKGAAVRTGVLAAGGARLLFADADGATPIEEERRLSAAIDAGAHLAVGSRLIAAAHVRRTRVWRRAVLGRLFAAVARRQFRLSIRDPQCGFKMFRREAGQRLFSLLHEPGFLFDLELLVLAKELDYPTTEVPIHWQEIGGGHFRPASNSIQILAGLWQLRRRLMKEEVGGRW
jgi:dolichyl-phosphate beta-glucosyltransferase